MSSALLYAAIVAVWGVVLVPMWLRRDGSRTRHRRTDVDENADVMTEPPVDAPVDDGAAYEDDAVPATRPHRPPPRRRTSRAAVIARRRRRTTGLTLLVITAVVTVATGLTPWWFILPPVGLLFGHLALLRVAAKMDAERRRERRLARLRAMEAARRAREAELRRAREAERLRRAREAELRRAREAAASAEVIEMPERLQDEVYDQYTDQRAVGD